MSIDIAKRRILSKVPLGEVIGETVKLTSKSGRLMGLCPFHDEKTPSFTIFDDHYFCFGCRAHGDAIEFIRQTRGMGFIETLQFLAEKFNIDVPELTANSKYEQDRQQTSKLYRVLQLSQEYFINGIQHQPRVVEYLRSRGFSDENIRKFEFGYAPDRPTGLIQYLLQKGAALADCVTASVATTSKKDMKTYDFFRHRLMIPIKDNHGRLIAYGGRTMGDDLAKYKNSRETPYSINQMSFTAWIMPEMPFVSRKEPSLLKAIWIPFSFGIMEFMKRLLALERRLPLFICNGWRR